MKRLIFAACFAASIAAFAAVPIRWTVETSEVRPAQIDGYRGETIAFEATLKSYGRPLATPLNSAALYWQTNGMGTAYWAAPASVSSNRVAAVWSPEMDVGATTYNCFIGETGSIYRAAFQLRLRGSPGAIPNELPLPTPVLDFSRVEVRNPPWPGLETVPPIVSNTVTKAYVESLGISTGLDTNAVREIARDEIVPATNAALSAAIAYTIAATNAITLTPGPQGPQGERGETGPQGPQGERGEVDPVALTNAVRAVALPAVSSAALAATNYVDAATNAVLTDANYFAVVYANDIGERANEQLVAATEGWSQVLYSELDKAYAAINLASAADREYTLSSLTNADATAWAATSATNSLAYLAAHAQDGGVDTNAVHYADAAWTSVSNAVQSHTSQLSQLSQDLSAETSRATLAELSLQEQIDLFKSFQVIVTNALPATGEDGCIYLTPIAGQTNRIEWLWVHEPSNHWEMIGTTAIDMAQYYRADETDAAISAATENKQDRLPYETNAIPSSAIAGAPWYVNGDGQRYGDAIYSRGMYSAGDINILTGSLVLEDQTRPLYSEGGLSVLGFTFYGGNRMYTAGDLKVDGPYDPDTGTEYPNYYIDIPKRYNGGLFSFVLNDDLATAEQNAAAYTDAATNGLETAAHAAASVSAVTSAVPARLPAATIAVFNEVLATNGIATLSADSTLYDALDRLMQMASRSSPGPVPPETDAEIAVTGGVVWYELENGDTVFEFKTAASGQSFTVLANASGYKADILAVGGGGAGGGWFAGGGGGGSVTSVVDQVLTVGQPYEVTVGFGGRRREHVYSSGNEAAGGNGGCSKFVGDGVDLFAGGGGGGGAFQVAGVYYEGVANGGGRATDNKAPSFAPVRGGGAGGGGTSANCAGGGGASDNGSGFAYYDADRRGWGREGVTNDITGVAQVYGSGGGGSVNSSLADAPNAGKGGTNAGDGCHADSIDGRDGVNGFGGGAGGGVSRYSSTGDPNGGNGGSGTVIVRVHGKCRVTGGIQDGYTILAGVNNSRSSASAGTICDVTNYYANAATRIEADFYVVSDNSNTQTLLCSRENSNNPSNNSFTLFAVTSGSGGSGWRFDCGPTAVTPSASVPGAGWRHAVLDAASGTASIITQSGAANPVAVPASPGMASPAPYPLRLFGSYSGTLATAGNIANGWVIYHVRISEGGETVHDLWPCRRVADQANGFIDTVSGAFYPIKTAGAAMMMMGRPASVDDEFPSLDEFAAPDESAAPAEFAEPEL